LKKSETFFKRENKSGNWDFSAILITLWAINLHQKEEAKSCTKRHLKLKKSHLIISIQMKLRILWCRRSKEGIRSSSALMRITIGMKANTT